MLCRRPRHSVPKTTSSLQQMFCWSVQSWITCSVASHRRSVPATLCSSRCSGGRCRAGSRALSPVTAAPFQRLSLRSSRCSGGRCGAGSPTLSPVTAAQFQRISLRSSRFSGGRCRAGSPVLSPVTAAPFQRLSLRSSRCSCGRCRAGSPSLSPVTAAPFQRPSLRSSRCSGGRCRAGHPLCHQCHHSVPAGVTAASVKPGTVWSVSPPRPSASSARPGLAEAPKWVPSWPATPFSHCRSPCCSSDQQPTESGKAV